MGFAHGSVVPQDRSAQKLRQLHLAVQKLCTGGRIAKGVAAHSARCWQQKLPGTVIQAERIPLYMRKLAYLSTLRIRVHNETPGSSGGSWALVNSRAGPGIGPLIPAGNSAQPSRSGRWHNRETLLVFSREEHWRTHPSVGSFRTSLF